MLLGVCTTEPNMCMVMELCKGGSLFDMLQSEFYNRFPPIHQQIPYVLLHLSESGPLPLYTTLNICLEVAAGLQKLHSLGITMADMKSLNILVCSHDLKMQQF